VKLRNGEWGVGELSAAGAEACARAVGAARAEETAAAPKLTERWPSISATEMIELRPSEEPEGEL